MASGSIDEDDDNEFAEDPENLQEILRFSGTTDFTKIQNIRCLRGSTPGDNYMSVVKKVIILSSDNQERNLSLIIKRQIASRSRRSLYRCEEAFNNEINAYTYIIPMLRQINPNLPYPKCYFAGVDQYGELIILEDLIRSGFQMEDRLAGLGLNHCQLVMKELANCHAASIFIKHKDNQQFLSNKKFINEIVYCSEADDFYRTVLETSIRESLRSLRLSNGDGSLSEPIRLIENLQSKLYEIIRGYVTQEKESFDVVCHGDLWVNNLMFKKDEEGRVCAVKFIDLQAMRYASPIFDILHFIYTSTKRNIRESCLKDILRTYSNSLISNLDEYFRPNHLNELEVLKGVYSFDSITQQFYSHVLYGLAVCMWVLPAVTFDPENIPNLDEVTLSDLKTSTQEENVAQKLTSEYHSRMKDIALEFYQKGFLNLSSGI